MNMLRLKEIRELKGIKKAKVANDLGLSRQGYAYYENGQRTPSTKVLKQLAEYFGVTTDYLLGSESKPEQPNTKLSPNNSNTTMQVETISSNNNDIKTTLTLEAIEKILKMNIEELKALNTILKTIK